MNFISGLSKRYKSRDQDFLIGNVIHKFVDDDHGRNQSFHLYNTAKAIKNKKTSMWMNFDCATDICP